MTEVLIRPNIQTSRIITSMKLELIHACEQVGFMDGA